MAGDLRLDLFDAIAQVVDLDGVLGCGLVAEELGVGTRGGYYDGSGATRDMLQNHLTQLLCVTAMELPAALEANFVRDEKAKVLRSMSPITPNEVIFGQYSAGELE